MQSAENQQVSTKGKGTRSGWLVASVIDYITPCIFPLSLSQVNKMSPRPSLVPTDADTSGSYGSPSYQSQQQQQQDSGSSLNNNNNNSGSTAGGGGGGAAAKQEPGRRAGACRVCLKSFKPDDYHKTCFECQQRVCEDCASYSKLDEHEDAVSRVEDVVGRGWPGCGMQDAPSGPLGNAPGSRGPRGRNKLWHFINKKIVEGVGHGGKILLNMEIALLNGNNFYKR